MRKGLGLKFVGETLEQQRGLLADFELKGLSREASGSRSFDLVSLLTVRVTRVYSTGTPGETMQLKRGGSLFVVLHVIRS